MVSDRKLMTVPEVAVQLPEMTKVAAGKTENGTVSDPLRQPSSRFGRRKSDALELAMRLLCLAAAVTAVTAMVTAREFSTVNFYGFQLPVLAKWSFSNSFEYLVGISTFVAAYSLLQLLINTYRLLRKYTVIASTNHAWLVFAADQLFAYLMMSAGSAASGVSNLNKTGIRHTTLPNFCKSLDSFCNHVAISIAFTFLSCFLLAMSAVLNVIWLSKH